MREYEWKRVGNVDIFSEKNLRTRKFVRHGNSLPIWRDRLVTHIYLKKLKLNISEMINNNAIFVCFGQEHVLHFYTFFQMNIFRQM